MLTVVSKKLSLVVGFFGLVCITAMMLLTTIDLVARFAFNRAVMGAVEVMSFMFCVTLYSGLAYCQTQHSHINVTLIVTKLPGRMKFVVWGITSLIASATGVLVSVASFIQAGAVERQFLRTAVLWIPYHPFYTIGGICMSLFSLCLLLDCVKSFLAVFKTEYADEVRSTWSM